MATERYTLKTYTGASVTAPYVPSSTIINPGQAAHWRTVLEGADPLLAILESEPTRYAVEIANLRNELAAMAEALK